MSLTDSFLQPISMQGQAGLTSRATIKPLKFYMAGNIIPMRSSHGDGVDGESVRDAVYALVEFHIPDHVYLSIDRAMCKFWNDDTEVNGTFNTEVLHTYVSKFVGKEKILYPPDKVRKIVDAIISYLTMVGIIRDV